MVIGNITSALLNLPSELVGKISFLISILQVLGGIIIFYIIFSIINIIINNKRNKRIGEILLGINLINENLEEIKGFLYKK